jgi:uroporphyrinogen-III synthase
VKPLVIVTRPAEAGERLLERLRTAGWDTLGWPAFEIGPAPDPEHARRTLAHLSDFDLAIFVSPAAVRAGASLLDGAWPSTTTIGAVGAATAVAIEEELKLPTGTSVIAPSSEGAAGSEAFWAEWERRGRMAHHVLILRAQHGREWLAERFGAAGAAVEALAVYTRTDRSTDPAARRELQRAMASSMSAIVVLSSSEAVDALDRQMAGIVGARAWLRQGVAIATHERIRDRLLGAGYTRVELSAPDDDAVVARLESL